MRNSEGAVLEAAQNIREGASQEDLVYGTLAANRGKWMTLNDISVLTGIAKEGSIASRIRDLRTQYVNIARRLNAKLSSGRTRVYEYCYPVSL